MALELRDLQGLAPGIAVAVGISPRAVSLGLGSGSWGCGSKDVTGARRPESVGQDRRPQGSGIPGTNVSFQLFRAVFPHKSEEQNERTHPCCRCGLGERPSDSFPT